MSVSIASSLALQISEDVMWGGTHDLPRLRYSGPQRVFLWDDMKYPESLKNRGLEESENYKVDCLLAVTQMNYLPFTRAGYAPFMGPTRFLFRAVNWFDNWKASQLEGFDNTPRPLEGRVLTVGVKGMEVLDDYHANNSLTTRKKITVYSHPCEHAEELEVWCYFAERQHVTRYDPHTKEYSLRNGDHLVNLPEVQGHYHLPTLGEMC